MAEMAEEELQEAVRKLDSVLMTAGSAGALTDNELSKLEDIESALRSKLHPSGELEGGIKWTSKPGVETFAGDIVIKDDNLADTPVEAMRKLESRAYPCDVLCKNVIIVVRPGYLSEGEVLLETSNRRDDN